MADPILARSLLTHGSSQAAFMIAAQCLDVRQTLMLVRWFGSRRAASALAAGVLACVAAAAAA
jgi:uncharacterized membrane protein YraQ (UPF0718 family)